ncbi:MAG: outer membrane beta-barrel protein [Alphaproteobacteria bacterium]|nr:outer membrane beta-barrel protein [Alphaproteobacteria bacterium]
MKHWLWTVCVSAIVASGPAFASDLVVPTHKTPLPPPVFTWTGCYLGGNLGAAWAGKRFTDESGEFGAIGTNVGSNTATGVVTGGQAGCDYQFAPNWLIGAQAMGDWARLHGSATIPNTFGGDFFKFGIDSFATATGRIGYIVDPTILIYAKVGVGFVRSNYSTSCNYGYCASFAESANDSRVGLDIGGGLEYKFAQNWSVFAEYDHVFLGSKNTTFIIADAGGSTYVERIAQDVDKMLIGVNYRFDTGGAPVSAKY